MARTYNSRRLQARDYSRRGVYFITLTMHGREPLLGEVRKGRMCLSAAGEVVRTAIGSLSLRFPSVSIAEFMVMPDHVHAIVVIRKETRAGAIHELPRQTDDSQVHRAARRRMLVPKVVGYLKMTTAKRINLLRDSPGCRVWQPDYHDRVIRTSAELREVRRYIRTNPQHYSPREDADYAAPLR